MTHFKHFWTSWKILETTMMYYRTTLCGKNFWLRLIWWWLLRTKFKFCVINCDFLQRISRFKETEWNVKLHNPLWGESFKMTRSVWGPGCTQRVVTTANYVPGVKGNLKLVTFPSASPPGKLPEKLCGNGKIQKRTYHFYSHYQQASFV